jgi:hypothetical protein
MGSFAPRSVIRKVTLMTGYNANATLFLTKNTEIKIYRTISPLVFFLCGCETWSLTLREAEGFGEEGAEEDIWT